MSDEMKDPEEETGITQQAESSDIQEKVPVVPSVKKEADGVTIKVPSLPKFSRPKVFLVGFALGALVLFIILFRVYRAGAASTAESTGLAPSVVFTRVQAKSELTVASQDYQIVDKVADTNKIPYTDISIPFTDNSFWYRYTGTIKVAVNLESATWDQTSDISAVVTIDQPYIASNTPNMDKSGVLEENNNVLNPIHVEDVDAFQAECVERSEEEVLSGTIMEEARANTEESLTNIFNAALGDDFTLTVVWRDK